MVIKIAELTLKIGRHFLDNEYGSDKPGLEKWPGMENMPNVGQWPEWWRGVTSLYAAELAVNHLVPELTDDYRNQEVIDGEIFVVLV